MSRPKVSHYLEGAIEPIDFIMSHNMNYALGTAIKYIARCNHKGLKQADLLKAIDYINFELETLKKAPASNTSPWEIVERDVPDGCTLDVVNDAGHIFLTDGNGNAKTFEHFNEFEVWAKEYRK